MLQLSARYVNRIKGLGTIKIFVQMASYLYVRIPETMGVEKRPENLQQRIVAAVDRAE